MRQFQPKGTNQVERVIPPYCCRVSIERRNLLAWSTPLPSHPLTHHEILTLISPFTRQGYHPDLAATDRLERRLIFKPVERAFETESDSQLSESLQLENRNGSVFRLTRTLACVLPSEEKLEAKLEMEGADPADLLACMEAMKPDRQFRFGPGFKIARSYRLIRLAGTTRDGAPATQPVLTKMSASIGDLIVTATAPTIKADPEAHIEIQPKAGEYKSVPDDLLAVLGWDWGLMQKRKDIWKSSLRLRGREPERSQRAETKLDGMVEHLVQTFTEAPAKFHERLTGARWGVAFRRALPLLISIALIGAAAETANLPLADDSPIRMMMMNLPGFLMVLVFGMRRMPVIEVPPFPRRLNAAAWREDVPLAAGAP